MRKERVRKVYEMVSIHLDITEEESQAKKEELQRELYNRLLIRYKNGTLFKKEEPAV